MIHELIELQQRQLNIFEKFLRFEKGISMQCLPKNFHQLEYFIACDLYEPLIKDSIAVEFKQKQYKIIQETKRTWLNIYLNAYEIQYQEYEHQYQQGLKRFELNHFSNHQENERIILMESFLTYMNHRQNRLIQVG